MKRIVLILIFGICLFSCRRTDADFIVSHEFTGSAPLWGNVDAAIVVKDTCGGSDNVMTLRTVWSKDSLYLFFQVSDSNLQCHQRENDHRKLFLDDMVEFLIDPLNDRGELWIEDDIIYHINILGFKKDDRGTPEGISDPLWNGAARSSIVLRGTVNDSSDIDGGYDVEVAVPWTELGVTPRPGMIMGVDFVCGDNDGKGRQLFDWAGASPFRHPIQFKNLILSD